MRGGLAPYRITLPAEGTKSLSIRGDFIFMRTASFAVEIEVCENQTGGKSGQSWKNNMRQGEKWRTDGEFDQLRFRNLQSTAMTIEIYAGFGDYSREVPERISTADINVTTVGTIAAANTPQLLVAERSFRKRVTVQARLGNGASVVRIAESEAQLIAGAYAELSAGAGLVHESKTPLYIESDTVGDIVVAIEEYWND